MRIISQCFTNIVNNIVHNSIKTLTRFLMFTTFGNLQLQMLVTCGYNAVHVADPQTGCSVTVPGVHQFLMEKKRGCP